MIDPALMPYIEKALTFLVAGAGAWGVVKFKTDLALEQIKDAKKEADRDLADAKRDLEVQIANALREGAAANRRLDDVVNVKLPLLDKEHAITSTHLGTAKEEIAILRGVRHKVIDTLNGVIQFLEDKREHGEEVELLRKRISELEGSKG